METKTAYLYLKMFSVFIAVLIMEYVLSGIYFRLIRHSDIYLVNSLCAAATLYLTYRLLKKTIREALKEKIPLALAAACFLVFWFLTACFFRFSVQLVNGLFDFSNPEARVVLVTGKGTSALGGSFQEGPNPLAHLLFFQDWDHPRWSCELLVPPPIYYTASPGLPIEITVRRGLFGLPWVEDYDLPNSHPFNF